MKAQTKGIVAYLAIAFGLAWVLWGIPIIKGVPVSNPTFQFMALPGAFAPAIAAIVVRKWVTQEGFRDAGLQLRPRAWRYYLFAWLFPLGVVLMVALLAIIFGVSQPDLSLHRALASLAPGVEAPPPLNLATVVVATLIGGLVYSLVLWGEEFGWRSYLQIRLFADRPLLAALVTGLIWGVWHFPLTIKGYQYPDAPVLGLLVLPVSTVLLSIIFGWLRLRSGSIWPVSLAHSAVNSIGGSLLILLFLGGPNWILVSFLGVLAWIPLGAICLWIILTGRMKPDRDLVTG